MLNYTKLVCDFENYRDAKDALIHQMLEKDLF